MKKKVWLVFDMLSPVGSGRKDGVTMIESIADIISGGGVE